MTVSISEHEVRIDGVSTRDVAVVAEFLAAKSQGKDPEAFLLSLLNLGAQVVSLGSSTIGAEKLEASISNAKSSIGEVARSFETAIKKQVSDIAAEDGTLLKGLESIVDNFRNEVDEMTSGEDSPLRAAMLKSLSDAQTKIRQDIQSQVALQKKEIATLLDPSDPTSPLRTLVDRMDRIGAAVAKVQEDVTREVAVAEVVEGSTVGGLNYEDEVVRFVQAIASRAGDDCEPTGNVTGRVPRNKMGDGVVDLKVGHSVYARIVIEAKNRALTKLEWERECEGSKANRAATGFIGLCKHLPDMPNASRILVLDSQSLVVAFDPELDSPELLVLVYQLIKINTLSSTGQLDDLNIAEVNKNLDDAVKALEKFDSITKNASAIRNSADNITKEANAIRSAISDRLTAAQNAIAKGMAADAIEPATSLELETGHVDIAAIAD